MIYIRVTARGEPDAPPLVRVYHYVDESDELILQYSVGAAREKLGKGMKVNVNEAMLLYCQHVVAGIRADKHAGAIVKSAGNVLAAEQVMVGVAETLKIVALDAVVDGRREMITLSEPIPPTGYAMAHDTGRHVFNS